MDQVGLGVLGGGGHLVLLVRQERGGVGGGDAQSHVPQEPEDLGRRVDEAGLGECFRRGREVEDVLLEGVRLGLLEGHGRRAVERFHVGTKTTKEVEGGCETLESYLWGVEGVGGGREKGWGRRGNMSGHWVHTCTSV